MNQTSVKNNVHRSGFDLSFRNCITQKTGEIIPCAVIETIPGDKFDINTNIFLRTEPFQQASFARLRHYVDAYFVPYRLLWDKFPAWIMQTKNQYYAKSLTGAADNFDSQPFITQDDIFNYLKLLKAETASTPKRLDNGGLDRLQTSIKLLSYMGYGLFNGNPKLNDGNSLQRPGAYNLPFNIFPLLAYQKIYQDYFRFAQWEDAAPWTYNLDYVLTQDKTHLDITSSLLGVSNLFDMRYCNYDKDLFNGLLPSAQYGDEAQASPILGALHGSLDIDIPKWSNSFDAHFPLDISVTPGTFDHGSITQEERSFLVNNSATLRLNQQDASAVAGVSVLGIRFAEALQKWREITLSGSPDYKEQLEKHWNVSISDYASDRCQYLGGCAQNIDISDVVNQNITGDNQADLAGKGLLSSNGHIKFKTDEYGVILIVSHVKPLIEWDANAVLHPYLTRHEATDYAIPEFDNLGLQPLYSANLYAAALTGSNTDVPYALGFAPRYFDYKTSYDRVNGGFLNRPGWTLNHQPLTIDLGDDSKFKITPSFFRVLPSITNDLFLPSADGTWDTDLYEMSIFFNIKSARNLSYDGLPY